MQTATAVVGLALVIFILVEVFEALVLPRRVIRPFRFTRLYYRFMWRTWGMLSRLVPYVRPRQTFLGLFGPLSLLVLFGVWGASLIVGFGLIHHGLAPRDGGFGDA